MPIKLAASSMLAVGQTPMEQLRFFRRCGFSGMELRLTLSEGKLPAYLDNLRAALENTGMEICSVIVPDSTWSLRFDDREAMEAKLATLVRNLRIAGPLGAVSLFCPEYRTQHPLPLWDPPPLMTKHERALLVELLKRAADVAEKVDGAIVIEPLNRYETHLVHRLEDAAELCTNAGSPRVGILADFYHMNFEEVDIEKSILATAPLIRHVQLADSNRLLPGQGHLDFKPGLRALVQAGYDRFVALECRAEDPLETALPRCADYLEAELRACK
ncbi:sugar phosphate isomerase/epimerase family protein [Chloroflexota bacterium]